jgi:PelA/Pel-15E family pectate lyase
LFIKPTEWYRSFEAHHTADCIVSFQTPAGGWSKNMSMNGEPRSPGTLFATENASRFEGAADFDAPLDRNWNYVGTFDNDATIMQLRFLAKVISAETNHVAKYLTSFQRGIDYMTAAQYPNGGWPQVWPLAGGYHDAITFNDNATINILTLLYEISIGTNDFNFVSRDLRSVADKSYQCGMNCLLASQVVTDGRRAIWPQQCDMLTLKPCSARNFEMPALASGESGNIVLFLMRLPSPSPEAVTAVHSAVAWFEKTQIRDKAFKSSGSDGRHLISAPGNGPIWARYYEIGSDKPLFGDRDKTIHDTVDEISRERRAGYSWYGDSGKRVLEHYKRWSKAHPQAQP